MDHSCVKNCYDCRIIGALVLLLLRAILLLVLLCILLIIRAKGLLV